MLAFITFSIYFFSQQDGIKHLPGIEVALEMLQPEMPVSRENKAYYQENKITRKPITKKWQNYM